jgi:iron complex outermembrane receptor protein
MPRSDLALGALLFLLTTPVRAPGQQVDGSTAQQESEPIEVPAVEAPRGIEAIEITGERLDMTNVQDEAQAITHFDMGDLDKLGISNVDGLATNVPGLHVGQQGQAAIITLRGVGTENASLTGEAGVAFHVDGVYLGRPAAARVAFYDLQFLDVKRGPQGLLGGKNSTSGTINVSTADPTHEYGAGADVLFGNYDRKRIRGHLNAPLGSGEVLAARAAFFYEERDGFLDNVFVSDSRDPFDTDNFGMRYKLLFTPSDAFKTVVAYSYFKEGGNGPQADLVPFAPRFPCAQNQGFRPPPNWEASSRTYLSQMPRSLACRHITPPGQRPKHAPGIEDVEPRKIYSNTLSDQDDLYWGLTGRMEFEVPVLPLVGETQLKLLGGYNRTENGFDWDFDASNLSYTDLFTESRVHEYSSELQWSGNALGEQLAWQSSLFFVREKGDSITNNGGFTSTDQTGGGAGQVSLTTYQTVENKSYGAALHGAYDLTDSLTFSLGGRWIKDNKSSFLSRQEGAGVAACVGGDNRRQLIRPDGTPYYAPLPVCELTDRGTMWGSRLELRPADGHLLYAGIDRGYKSGGFGLGGVGGYLPEKIWAYTLGSKSEFFDQRLQVNLEGFAYNYQDMQIALIDGTSVRTENADTRMYGVELEAAAMPIDGLQLRAVITFLKTETLDYLSLDPSTVDNLDLARRFQQRAQAEDAGTPYPGDRLCFNNIPCSEYGIDGLEDYSGNQLSRSPQWKYTLSGEYAIPLGRFGTLTPRAQYAWVDDSYQRVFNAPSDLQEDYHKTDIKLIWNSPEQRWSIEAFVDNIEDEAVKDYILIGTRIFNSPPLAWYSEPRFYGVQVGFKY